MNCTGGRGTAGIPTCGTAGGSTGGGGTGATAPTTPPATPGPKALPQTSLKLAGVMAGVAGHCPVRPGVTNRTRNSPPWSTSPRVVPWHTVWAPALTAEQVKPEVRLLSTPIVVETKMNGTLLATVPAGASAVTLKVNEATLDVLPVGPTVRLTCGLTVQVWPTCSAQAALGVPATDGVATVAIAVSSAAAVCVAFAVAVGVGVRVVVGVLVGVDVGRPGPLTTPVTSVTVPPVAKRTVTMLPSNRSPAVSP